MLNPSHEGSSSSVKFTSSCSALRFGCTKSRGSSTSRLPRLSSPPTSILRLPRQATEQMKNYWTTLLNIGNCPSLFPCVTCQESPCLIKALTSSSRGLLALTSWRSYPPASAVKSWINLVARSRNVSLNSGGKLFSSQEFLPALQPLPLLYYWVLCYRQVLRCCRLFLIRLSVRLLMRLVR